MFPPGDQGGIPNACKALRLGAYDNVPETVAVHVEDANLAWSIAIRPERHTRESVLFEPSQGFAKSKELDSFAVGLLCVVDEIHPLLGSAPAVGMEHRGEHTLLFHNVIER